MRRRLFSLLAVVVLTVGLGVARHSEAFAATKTVYIPPSWASSGDVPWAQNRTKESANFILLWGEKSGIDPKSAPAPYNFDPDNILQQLETLYSFYVDTMRFTPEAGVMAAYKIDVIVTTTWNNTALSDWATGGSADNKVGVINVAPGAAQPGSWGLAHELGHVFQNFTFLGKSGGVGLTDPSAGTFWETSAEYMAMQVYPDGGAGDLTRFLRTENLAYSSSRHHYGAWMLVQYLVDKHGGLSTFNRIWNEATSTEHPLETYRRIAGLTQDQLNAQLGEYAEHQVTFDYSNASHFLPFIRNVYGAGFINAYNGVPVDAVGGHYAIADALAPSDYGYNKIKLVPSSDGALVRLHFKGHVNSAAGSGWSYGFVAVKNGVPRYGPISTSADGQISFQLQSGENEVYLVVLGAPSSVHHYAFLDGYPKNYRYPYEFAVSGAVPSGYEPGYQKPAATAGGHWHSNGGGWVDNRATVAATAYVGPRAAVYGTSTVSGNARIEGLAWVNSGATVGGNAVVKDNALVQGGADLSGSIVVGGDAEFSTACGAGTYLLFNPDRGCDGRTGEADVNPAYTPFTDADVAISGTTTTPPTSPPTSGPTTAPATRGCAASLAVIGSWSGGYQGEVTVTAGATAIATWAVTWTLPAGQQISQSWNAGLTTAGTAVTARNVDYNGTLTAGAKTTFGFLSAGTPSTPTLTCTAT